MKPNIILYRVSWNVFKSRETIITELAVLKDAKEQFWLASYEDNDYPLEYVQQIINKMIRTNLEVHALLYAGGNARYAVMVENLGPAKTIESFYRAFNQSHIMKMSGHIAQYRKIATFIEDLFKNSPLIMEHLKV